MEDGRHTYAMQDLQYRYAQCRRLEKRIESPAVVLSVGCLASSPYVCCIADRCRLLAGCCDLSTTGIDLMTLVPVDCLRGSVPGIWHAVCLSVFPLTEDLQSCDQEGIPMVLRMVMLLLVVVTLQGQMEQGQAEIVVRKSGASWARIDDDGTIRIRGRSVGKFESNGTVRKRGSSVGSIDQDGTIRKQGSSVGKVENDGTVRRRGSSIGCIESSGTIRKQGSSWGSASNCCGSFGGKKAVAALLVFFADDYF